MINYASLTSYNRCITVKTVSVYNYIPEQVNIYALYYINIYIRIIQQHHSRFVIHTTQTPNVEHKSFCTLKVLSLDKRTNTLTSLMKYFVVDL